MSDKNQSFEEKKEQLSNEILDKLKGMTFQEISKVLFLTRDKAKEVCRLN